jgi:hypothetical protein
LGGDGQVRNAISVEIPDDRIVGVRRETVVVRRLEGSIPISEDDIDPATLDSNEVGMSIAVAVRWNYIIWAPLARAGGERHRAAKGPVAPPEKYVDPVARTQIAASGDPVDGDPCTSDNKIINSIFIEVADCHRRWVRASGQGYCGKEGSVASTYENTDVAALKVRHNDIWVPVAIEVPNCGGVRILARRISHCGSESPVPIS